MWQQLADVVVGAGTTSPQVAVGQRRHLPRRRHPGDRRRSPGRARWCASQDGAPRRRRRPCLRRRSPGLVGSSPPWLAMCGRWSSPPARGSTSSSPGRRAAASSPSPGRSHRRGRTGSGRSRSSTSAAGWLARAVVRSRRRAGSASSCGTSTVMPADRGAVPSPRSFDGAAAPVVGDGDVGMAGDGAAGVARPLRRATSRSHRCGSGRRTSRCSPAELVRRHGDGVSVGGSDGTPMRALTAHRRGRAMSVSWRA